MTIDEILALFPYIEERLLKDPDYLIKAISPKEVSEITGIPVETLATLRSKGGGPNYLNPGNRSRIIRYMRHSVFEWLAAGGLKRHTHDIDKAS